MLSAHEIAYDKAFDGLTPLRRRLLEGEITEAIEAERESCARIAEGWHDNREWQHPQVAEAIRARSR